MPHYQTYFIGQDGEFKNAIVLDCANDDAAVESAKQLVNGLDVELWQDDRLVRRFQTDDKAASPTVAGSPSITNRFCRFFSAASTIEG